MRNSIGHARRLLNGLTQNHTGEARVSYTGLLNTALNQGAEAVSETGFAHQRWSRMAMPIERMGRPS